jgi:gliding motility-associated protein GldM
MAGGKETPRQKMIGMMYLVLTALLALQVSNAVLEKFAIIIETMHTMIDDGNAKNQAALDNLVKEAGKSQKENVLKAKDNAQKVRDLTKSTLKYIDDLKERMYQKVDADGMGEKVINNHGSGVATMMIDRNSNEKEGEKYEALLNTYVKELSSLSGLEFEKIAKPPKEMPLFASDADHSRKDFLTFTFENTPIIAALASVTQHQTEILEYEARALDQLQKVADVGTFRLDQFVPLVRPKSSVVAAGAKYEAELFLTGSSSAINPEFFMNGTPLPVSVDPKTSVKMGKIEFTASGGNYDAQGFAKKTFIAKIQLNDQPFEDVVEYTVAQPTIKVTTGNAPTLYMNCGNTVLIEVPALGTSYNPAFSAGGAAEIIKGGKPGQVTIIPKQRKISVAVSNGGTPIGNQGFDVKNIPDPRYIAYIGNQPVDLRTGIRANQLGNLRFVAEPESNFKEEVPKDARYNIKRAQVQLGRGTTPVQSLNATNGNPDLRAWIGQARPGDRLIIDIKEVGRRNFKDEEERVDIKGSTGIIQIPIL